MVGCFSFFSRSPWSGTKLTKVVTDRLQKNDWAPRTPTQQQLGNDAFGNQKALDTTARLAQLRGLMQENKVEAYVVTTQDEHNSEYVADHDQRRVFISGFTGSAGTALITLSEAFAFIDSRYYIQAEKQLDSNWQIQKLGQPGVVDWPEFLIQYMSIGDRVGFDATLVPYKTAKALIPKLEAQGVTAVYPSTNLVDSVWGDEQPSVGKSHLFIQDLELSGQPAPEKLANLRRYLAKEDGSAFLIASLPDIAWLLNLRGSDVRYNPVFKAYALVTLDRTLLFVDQEKITASVRKYLQEDAKVTIRSYDDVWDELEGLNGNCLSSTDISWALFKAAHQATVRFVRSPVTDARAIKNATEIEGFRKGYLRDGVAWVRWSAWLINALESGAQIDEWQAAEELTRKRSEMENFWMESYPPILAVNENAALPHYETTKETAQMIKFPSVLLNDTGANYTDCTIDTTRTVWLGGGVPAPDVVKRAFTRVLQGHIALATAVWPEGTTGYQLDPFAKRMLWQDGGNYAHGSGHGFGSFLNVHEGPQGFGSSKVLDETAFLPGHVLTVEPGFYLEGQFGVRIESAFVVKETDTLINFGPNKWLSFERLTQVPIETTLVDFGLLSYDEREWLRHHNDQVRQRLLPFLKGPGDKFARKYLDDIVGLRR